MSGNPLHSYDASDSGILGGLDSPLPKFLRADGAAERPSLHGAMGPLRGRSSSSPMGSPAAGASAGDEAHGNAIVDGRLREISLPAGFLDRMHRAVDRF